jgi:DNA primase
MEEQLFTPANKEILNYLTGRGLSKETIQSFRIGYAPPDRQALRKFLLAEKFTDEQIFEAGLVRKKDGEQPYAFFRERVMFPVGDRRGRIVAFGGRILPDHMREPDKGDYKPAKYMNSSDTPLFDKSRTLYGQSFARQAAREGATVLVTEGYMDVIACHQAGFSGAVAPMGTALTEDQIVMLWSMIVAEEKIPVLCFDGDNAGRGAAVRACEKILPLLKPYHSARFAFMPEGEDPDTLIKSGGAKAFQDILDSAISLFDFLWLAHTGGRNFDSPKAARAWSRRWRIRSVQLPMVKSSATTRNTCAGKWARYSSTAPAPPVRAISPNPSVPACARRHPVPSAIKTSAACWPRSSTTPISLKPWSSRWAISISGIRIATVSGRCS